MKDDWTTSAGYSSEYVNIPDDDEEFQTEQTCA